MAVRACQRMLAGLEGPRLPVLPALVPFRAPG
jgi:hypothetical protein